MSDATRTTPHTHRRQNELMALELLFACQRVVILAPRVVIVKFHPSSFALCVCRDHDPVLEFTLTPLLNFMKLLRQLRFLSQCNSWSDGWNINLPN